MKRMSKSAKRALARERRTFDSFASNLAGSVAGSIVVLIGIRYLRTKHPVFAKEVLGG
jgi:hypothetical protein